MWVSCLSVWFVQVILGLRFYALYNGSKKVLLVISLGFIAESIVMIVSHVPIHYQMKNLCKSGRYPQAQGLPVLGTKVSPLPAAARKVYINYGALAMYESILFLLALSAAVHRYREKRGLHPARSEAKCLRDVLIEGNVMYFFVSTLYAIFYFVVSLTLPAEEDIVAVVAVDTLCLTEMIWR
ncbi:hypothetical protein M404DRAFT_8889 [Pisolithus tinctorius Marx 270]|uniref:Uncharacterized protein n=1 Tax=Pisolithus tinctorius Marx 270 TaxID=870435 RepID=A0A0C3PE52_PISTI|nr:hypothetical protein M404DRAFT_8889 [Pisolithus tinctorius Marx 270]